MKRFIVNVLFFSSFLLALAIGMECMLRRVRILMLSNGV